MLKTIKRDLLGLNVLKLRFLILIIAAISFALFTNLVTAAEVSQEGAVPGRASVLTVANTATLNNVAGADGQARERAGKEDTSQNFKALDMETEAVLKEVLNLSSDLAIIDERENNPEKFQLFVLVTMEPTNLFELDFIELRVDKQVVAAHHYSNMDISALSRGGGHRLYLANLPAGVHELEAKMVGKIPRDPDYRRDTRFNFISGVARTIVELRITGEASKGFPNLVPREWNR